MPDATITSTASTFGTITGTFAADQSTVTGTVTSLITGTLSGSVGVPGPVGPQGPQGEQGPPGPPGVGGVWGTITGTLSNQTDLQTALNLKANLASPVFTGDPQAPTAAFGDNDTTIATTAFVQAGLLGGTANAKNLEVYVRNQSGSTIPAGSIVYISGATGNRPLITLAQANNDANSAQTMGFVKTSIANNGFGYVIVRGELENIDTSALTEGVQLYLSPTTPGAWTTTKPSAPQHLVYVGIVVRAHPTQGTILVAVQNGYELDELHDVSISSKANNDLLTYESSTNLWKNKSFGTLGLATQAWVDAQGYLQAGALTGYALESWVTAGFYPLTGNPSGFLTSSSLTPYLTKADNLGSLTNFATARSNLSLGTLDTPVFAGVTAQGSGSNVANLTPSALSITHSTFGNFTIQPSSGITFPDSSVQTTAFTTAQLSAYLAKASNLSDLPSASTARTNLGLGSLAVVNDAPSDGNQYARKNGAWDVVTATSSYITSVSSPLSVTGGNLTIDLSAYLTTSAAASTYQTLAGMSSYLTTSAAASTYYPLTGNPSGFITSSALTGYATESWVTSQGYLTSAALTGYATESWVTAGFYPLTGNPSGFITSAALSPYLLSSTAASTYQTIAGMSSYLTTSAAASTYYPLSSNPSGYLVAADISGKANSANAALTGNVTITTNSTGAALFIEQSGTGNILTLHDQASDTTFVAIDQNGKVNTIASTTTNAGFNVPHGTAPTTPVNGDVWTTTGGIFWRQNGSTKQAMNLGDTQTVSGNITFSNASLTLGNSTAAATYNLGTGATLTATTKAINIGTNGVSGSTTNIAIGSAVSGATSNITLNGTAITTASTTTASGLRIPHGTAPTSPTNGDVWTDTSGVYFRVDGVTQQLAPFSALTAYASLNSPTFTGVPLAPTASAGTSTTQIATTAFVTTANNLKANLAGATFTGLVSTPASATGGAGFRIVPGVAPTTPTNGDLWATTTDLQVRLNGVTETLAEQSWVTSQGYITSAALSSYAPLASPTFTGTVTIPAGASISGYATTASLASYAPLASPALTGTPTAPTAAVDTNTTQVATTAYVVGQGYLKSATASSTYAPLASPALTGTPTAPTATAGTSTTQLATTAFVTTADNLKANLASPAFTGTPTAPTATAGTNTTQIATTAFVTAAIPTNSVKAWVNFNGTGTVAIRASLNVTSITDNGTGDYTVNFTTALADANYSCVATTSPIYASNGPAWAVINGTNAAWTTEIAPTTSAIRVGSVAASGFFDSKYVCVSVFR